MQVWELIRELRKFDGKLMVVVEGYRSGLIELEEPHEVEAYILDKSITKAVYIGR